MLGGVVWSYIGLCRRGLFVSSERSTVGSPDKKERVQLKQQKRYVIVRTNSAGVFAGFLESRNGQEVVMTEARRLWYWAGAASLSELAVKGTSKPKDCKFPVAVARIELMQAIEVIDVTEDAQKSIGGVKEWSA